MISGAWWGFLRHRLRSFNLFAVLHRGIETGPPARMTRSPRLVYLNEQAITVTVDSEVYKLLGMTTCRPLNPEFLSGPRPIGRLTTRKRTGNTLDIHPCHHQDLTRGRILGNCRDQPCLVKFECRWIKRNGAKTFATAALRTI